MLYALISRRKEKKWTQAKLAKKANISRAYYANIEVGRKVPSLAIAKKIADVLDTSVDDIFFT